MKQVYKLRKYIAVTRKASKIVLVSLVDGKITASSYYSIKITITI